MGEHKNQQWMQADIDAMISMISKKTEALNGIVEGIKIPGEQRKLLDSFLDVCGLEKTEESRYAAYMRIANMHEDNLINYLEKNGFSQEEKLAILDRAYDFTKNYHCDIHEKLLAEMEQNGLFIPFYREIFHGVHAVGIAFNAFYKVWNSYLIHGVNPRLEKRFGSQQNIMEYLTKNDLLDKGHHEEIADRSYSVLREKDETYEKLAYIDAFPKEIDEIIRTLWDFKNALENHEDTIYHQRDAYISYITALIAAFCEKNTNQLVTKWAAVDTEWMRISTPFQIVHPLEFYEDIYRKAVAPEWELRIQNTKLFDSHVQENMVTMFSTLCGEKQIPENAGMRIFSLGNIQKTQLHIASPALYYGSHFNGLCSAQIVPNDEEVSKLHGKKIFSFAQNILGQLRTRPQMKITRLMIEESLRKKREKVIFGEDAFFYQLYDIETLGHEFGHTLWLEPDTESRMNITGNFKNIEEWKATTGGLMAFFLNPEESMKEAVIVDLITRSLKMIEWMKIDDARNYYIEWLIHLNTLFQSKMIFENAAWQIEMHFSDATFSALKELYLERYNELSNSYIRKEDASNFLFEFTIIEDGVFLPEDEKVRGFVKRYYELYEECGNVVEETV